MKVAASTTALLVRCLRQDARQVGHHVLRGGLAAMLLLMLVARYAMFSISAGAGASFARTVMYCCYACVTLLGGMYFSAAIVEGKEEQTLPLLRLTGAATMAILVGKSAPRLISVLLLLLVVAPFLLLAITLGGVSLRGLMTALLGLLVYSVMLCQLGLYCSVVGRNFQDALGRTMILWGVLEFLPLWGWTGSTVTAHVRDYLNRTEIAGEWALIVLDWLHLQLTWLTSATTELTLYGNLPFYLADFRGEPIWRPQMTAHLVVAGFFLCCSRLRFESMTAKVVAEGFDDRSHQLRPTRQARKPRRVHGRALVWKSWRWLSGGWFWFSFRLVGMPLFDRLFAIEIQQETLDSLLLLPHSRNSMFRQMVLGLLPGILASLSSLICGLILIFATDSRAVQQTQDVLASPWLYYIFVMLISTLYFGVFLSIKLRYGGMLVAIVTLWFVGPMIVSSIFAIVSTVVGLQKINDFGTTALPLLLIVVQVAFCVWLHKRLIQSLEHAGAES